jgi:hypothetical protein
MASYTHIVRRASGYVTGWLTSQEAADDFAAECNRVVPSDPAHVEELSGDWSALEALAGD